MTLLEDEVVPEVSTVPEFQTAQAVPKSRWRMLRSIPRDYRDLGRTKYGLRPIMLFCALAFFEAFDTYAGEPGTVEKTESRSVVIDPSAPV